ncbi:MAG TPA: addiction module protein, partial [Caulobacteraceae bacterium]|nr:addiction module protein [Caulobacteraceae bacterium]
MRTIVINELTPAEKLELIEALWESLESEDFPLTHVQMEEIERRLGTADQDAAKGKTLEEVLEGLQRRQR